MLPDVEHEAALQMAIERFWEAIPPTWHRVRRQVNLVTVEQFDITVEQFHILRHMRKGASSVSDLADVKQISRSAISQALDALVEKGLITRQQDCHDRRYVKLTLTPVGQDLIQAIFKENRAWMSARLAGLNTEELATIARSLELLKKALDG